ncbi:chromate transporter [Clostridium sp. AF32-12BH]|uniref:chromate transporter n=1 Tax=Clostridium sp. AF32-12BH TaxID=2292006 RepID=UPI000E498D9D|nr:chromate transporter [Clostridium sp. AF32-12BH]RHP44679.1 chromate transporter [Clostridium sp. AF32-12BH]
MEHHNNPTQEASLKQSNASVLKKLFFSTLYLSTFTFGGGYVIVSLLKTKFVDELHWIDETEMLDLIAIAQSSPGAIAVNGAIVVGYKLAGMPGILCSILGAILPPFVIITAVSAFYNAFRESFFIQNLLNGMRAGVGAVIISVVYDMGGGVLKLRSLTLALIMIAAFIANYILKINVILIILVTALIGAVRTVITVRRENIPSAGKGENE